MRRTSCLLMLRLVVLLTPIAWPVPQALPQARPDPVALGLDWKAEAEYGGYHQVVATGLLVDEVASGLGPVRDRQLDPAYTALVAEVTHAAQRARAA